MENTMRIKKDSIEELTNDDLNFMIVETTSGDSSITKKAFNELFDLARRYVDEKARREISLSLFEKLQNYCNDNDIDLNRVDIQSAADYYKTNRYFDLSIENTKIQQTKEIINLKDYQSYSKENAYYAVSDLITIELLINYYSFDTDTIYKKAFIARNKGLSLFSSMFNNTKVSDRVDGKLAITSTLSGEILGDDERLINL